ncbi:MAG: DUF4430 domain-containing protein [bacterium]|nr:DUF4430 domain-containing protein [bacterium]
MPNTNKGTLFLLFSIVLLGSGVALTASLQGGTSSPVLPQTEENVQQEPQLLSVTLEAEGAPYELKIAPGSTVYDLMVKAAQETGFTFSGREFAGLGFYVDTINGKKESTRNSKYWIYYINRQKAPMGISWYELQAHDIISFELEDEE